jgi:hypothetical protein
LKQSIIFAKVPGDIAIPPVMNGGKPMPAGFYRAVAI